jgi:hypothetical protein
MPVLSKLVIKNGYIASGNSTITGSLISTQGVNAVGGFTGSLQGTASYALTASFALNGGGGGNPRVLTISSSLTPAFDLDSYDELHITALSGNITSFSTNLTGTPSNSRVIIITIEDNGTARSIIWGALFVSMLATLPTTTVVGKKLAIGLKYNSTTSLWECWAASLSS